MKARIGNLGIATMLVGCVTMCYGQAIAPPEVKKELAKELAVAEADVKNPDVIPARLRVLGWKEWVWVVKPDLILRAKLDTGARTCSIHATNIETLELDGKKWVKFTISDPGDEKSKRLRYKAEVVRIAKVKNDQGGLDERYVVILPFQIGGEKLDAEFTLNDRGEMTCAVLIGRNILAKLGAVDAGKKYMLEKPKLPTKTKKAKKPVKS